MRTDSVKRALIGWAILTACQPAVTRVAPVVDSGAAPVASVVPASDPMATLMERELLIAERFGENCHFERDCGALWDVRCGDVHHFVKVRTLDELVKCDDFCIIAGPSAGGECAKKCPPTEWKCASREVE
jgi:hypothetical protein